MQFMILFIGVLVFVFYLFNQPPVFHNQVLKDQAMATEQAGSIRQFEQKYDTLFSEKQSYVRELVNAIHEKDAKQVDEIASRINSLQDQETSLRKDVRASIEKAIPGAKTQDRDYIFLNFVLTHLPHGVIGLLLAVMFSAAMSSMAGELNALASTSTIDIYKRAVKKLADPKHYLRASQGFTILWALLAMVFAMLATFSENLIQFVNIVGSLFYGTILGIFLCAFYLKRIKSNAVFIAAIVSECVIFYLYFFQREAVAFLLYNIIACAIVVFGSLLLQPILPKTER
jgi:Na+(H+)/acetate symporter ActP